MIDMKQYEAALMKQQRRGNERRLDDIGFGASLVDGPITRDPVDAPGDQPIDDSDLTDLSGDVQPVSED